jgi:DNA-binding MarR family transcriptional regulator
MCMSQAICASWASPTSGLVGDIERVVGSGLSGLTTSGKHLSVHAMNAPRKEDSLTLEILEAIEGHSDLTQRGLARRTGMALGLANSYLKRCVRKGLVKVQQAPANRYLYYLTPQGFAEKSRLTAEYLSFSFGFYRKACESCDDALRRCANLGAERVGFFGVSELAEIASLRAQACSVRTQGIADPKRAGDDFLGHRVVGSTAALRGVQVWILTDVQAPQESYEQLLAAVSEQPVIVPEILGLRPLAP